MRGARRILCIVLSWALPAGSLTAAGAQVVSAPLLPPPAVPIRACLPAPGLRSLSIFVRLAAPRPSRSILRTAALHRRFFDGAKAAALPSAPVAVPAEARPPALSLAAPDPGLAGLSGAKALASYRAPARLRRSIAGLRVAQGACFAAAAFLISRSEGWLPFLAAAAVEAALVPRMAEDRRRAGPLEFPRFEPWLSGDCAEILSLLVRRLGLPEDRAPAVAVADDFGARNAAVQGQGIRKESRVTIGSGFAGADLRPVAGVLAHELGHLALGDASSWKPKDSAMALFALSMASLVFIFAGAAAGFLSPRDLVRAVCLEMAAFPLGVAGVVVGAALQRRIELRADHFSGWLTDPRWLIEHFREGGEPVDFRSSPWGADHPDNAARIRSLEREFGLRDR